MNEVSVTGLAELERFLAELPERLQVKIARAALAAGAREIRDEARKIVPVKSGDLRKTIRASTRRGKDGMVTASIRAGSKKAFYAHFVEYGTQPHDIRSKNGGAMRVGKAFRVVMRHPGAKAKPFMRPALDSKARDAIEATAAKMRERLGDLKK